MDASTFGVETRPFLIVRRPTSFLLANAPSLNHTHNHNYQPNQSCACRSHESQLRVTEQSQPQKQVCLEVEMPSDTRQHGLLQA